MRTGLYEPVREHRRRKAIRPEVTPENRIEHATRQARESDRDRSREPHTRVRHSEVVVGMGTSSFPQEGPAFGESSATVSAACLQPFAPHGGGHAETLQSGVGRNVVCRFH